MTAPVVPAQRKRVGRPALTSRATILAAARRIGFAELTVGQATAAVGVKYSTFYRHFPKLGSLVSALVGDVLAGVEWPPPNEEWPARLSGCGVALRDACVAHPGLADAIRARGGLPAPLAALAADAPARFGPVASVLVDATVALALAGVDDRGFGLLLDGAHVQVAS